MLAGAVLLVSLLQPAAPAPVRYSVTPAAAEGGVRSKVRVTLTLPKDAAGARVSMIMPRAIPMGYSQVLYDQFVTVHSARTRAGAAASITRGEGPRWSFASPAEGDPVSSLEYEVDLQAMEASVFAGGDSSRAREGYVYLLGYSLFAFVEGFEDRAVDLTLVAPSNHPDWPVFSTLAPRAPATTGPLTVLAADFYNLAVSQVLLGPNFRVTKLRGAPDLFLVVRAEGPVDQEVMAPLAEQAYDALI